MVVGYIVQVLLDHNYLMLLANNEDFITGAIYRHRSKGQNVLEERLQSFFSGAVS